MLYIHFCISYITIKMYRLSWISLNNKVQKKSIRTMITPLTKQTSPNIPNNFTRKTKDNQNHAATTHIKQPDKQNLKISKSTTHTKIKTDKYNNTSLVTWKTTFNSTHRSKKTAQMPTSPTNLRWITKDHITQQLHRATINSPNTKQIKIPNPKQNT